MKIRLPWPGTLLNTLTVILGSALGLVLHQSLPAGLMDTALVGIGLVNLAMGVKMFMGSESILMVAGAIVFGGVIGALCGITPGLDAAAETLRRSLGAEGDFNQGLVTASVLFCVGPMTLLGCVEDGLQGHSELLRIKSLLDGVASIFLAATLGAGVLASAAVVLIVQGAVTSMAKTLRPLVHDEVMQKQLTAVGGILILAIGLNLAKIAKIPTADYLPALVVAPAMLWASRRWRPA